MNAAGTMWTNKNRVGLRAKVAKEVWEEANEDTKKAVHAKIAGIIADKQEKSSATRSAKLYLE